ncbi:MAG: hypothetical protein JXA21_14465 [Anaerolineae bacterium]|nr:hypothetical protein [Anaerolineae bacterium]
MTAHLCRGIAFAGTSLTVIYEPRTAALVELLYRNIPSADPDLTGRVYRLAADSSGVFSLHLEDQLLYQGTVEAEVAAILLGETCHHLAAESRGGLVFHAAALSRAGQGILFPGSIGAGKTTLTAWLVTQGYTYLTDELVYVPAGTTQMHTLARPLNLKAGSRAALRPYFDFDAQASHMLSTSGADLIPAELLAPIPLAGLMEKPGGATPVRWIVFPRYTPDAPFEFRALSPAQAGLRLMQCLVNARNLLLYGFRDAVSLARSTPAYSLSYAGFDQIAIALAQMCLRDF